MRKYIYKDEIYREEQLDQVYALVVNDCLEEGDYDDIMLYDEFTMDPGRYITEIDVESVEAVLGIILEKIRDAHLDEESAAKNDAGSGFWAMRVVAETIIADELRKLMQER